MLGILRSTLEAVLPTPPAVARCRRAPRDALLKVHTLSRRPGSASTALLPYDVPLVRAAITANKFHHYQRAAELLAYPLARYLETIPEPVMIVPIPLAPERERTRGHNQVTTVAALAITMTVTRVEIDARALTRVRETVPQTSLKRAARRENVRSAFAGRSSPHIAQVGTVILLDDVLTTGATMEAARAALAPHLPTESKLHCLALAH